jgi:hypothetical protein
MLASTRRRFIEGELTMTADLLLTIDTVTTRGKAHALLDDLPEDRMDAAPAALEAVAGPDTSIEAILARHGEQRLAPDEFKRYFGSPPKS